MTTGAPATLLALLARLDGDARPFAQARSEVLSGAEFAARARRLGRRFRAAGVRPSARVCAYLEHGIEQAVFPFACAVAGAIAVIVNPRLKDAQVRHVVEDCGASHVLTTVAKCLALADAATAFGTAQVVFDAGTAPDWGQVLTTDEHDGSPGDDPDAPAILLYTSGSTGQPKGIVQSHRSLCDGARIVAGYLELGTHDNLCAVLPLSFDYGLNQVLSAAYARATVTLAGYLTAGELLRTVVSTGCTGLAAVPEIWVDLVTALQAAAVEPGELHALRYVTNSGGRLPHRVIDHLAEHLPWVRVFSMYGLTEAFRSSFVPPGELAARPRSVGRAMPEVELLVVDPDRGTPVPPGEVGELVHCGACVGLGYWDRPADTAQRFRPHPVRGVEGGTCVFTGDLARMDPKGWIELVGRADAQIKVGGYRVSPDEIVTVAREVAGVQTAAAVGVPGAADGIGALALALVLARDVDGDAVIAEILQRCRRTLPPWMVPSLVRVVAALPRGPNQKTDLAAVRLLFSGESGA